ncbi:MAG: glycosyltransferase [Planctomycetota bacterium]
MLLWDVRATYGREHVLRLVRAFAAEPEASLVTSDLRVERDRAREYVAVDLAPAAPVGCWQAGCAIRRERLLRVDVRAFAPVELELLEAARADGSHRHVAHAEVVVDGDAFDRASEEARVDAELLRLARLDPLPEPLACVLLATHERREILEECLASFARQLVRPGTFELVVIDDASTDGTPELLDAIELPVPLQTFRNDVPSGATAARNLGLPHARGTYVIFVNDDTIAPPDLVRRHLEAHRDLGPRAMVLGLFEQPQEILANALDRSLERGNLVFSFGAFEPGQELSGAHFYTCNASVRLAAVREIGDFDPTYAVYGGEDTDLGLRLEREGYRLHYRPECFALHRHRLDLDWFLRRQRLVARAYVKLYRDHPALLDGQPFASRRLGELRDFLDRALPVLPTVEDAARALAGIDLGALEAGGREDAGLAERLVDALRSLLVDVNNVQWTRGLVDGFEQLDVDGFPGLLEAVANGTAKDFTHA